MIIAMVLVTKMTDGILVIEEILVINRIKEEMKSNRNDNTEMKPNNIMTGLKIPAEMRENVSRKEQEELRTLHAALLMEQ